MKILAISLLVLGLGGCFDKVVGTKAPKPCADFAYQEKCDAKDHCMWADGSCKDK